jgi:3-oxoacyl-[acyl-carrier protein] reductase
MPAPLSSNRDMTGQVAFVTGAARNIGAAVCRSLADAGVDIVATDILDCADTVASVEQLGRRATGLELDVTDRAAVGTVIDDTVKEFGRLDIVVCSAGIMPQGTMECSAGQWERVYKINVDGTYHCIVAAWPHMVAANFGKIVTLASAAGHQGGIAGPEYSSSKGAIIALTKHTARHGGPHNIYCNTVSPGTIATDLNVDFVRPWVDGIPLGRYGECEDVAEPIRFLCSPAANYVTGIVLPAGGGFFLGL